MGCGHVGSDAVVQGDAEGAGLCCHGVIAEPSMGSSALFGENTSIDVTFWTVGEGEQWEVSQTWTPASSAVVHAAEASDKRTIQCESALVAAAIGISHRLCHAIWQRSSWKDISTVAGPN